METQSITQSPFQKVNFGNSRQKVHINRYQSILALLSFTRFLTLLQIFCPGLQLQRDEIDICNKEIRRHHWVLEEDVRFARLLSVQKMIKKHFAQLKMIDMMGRKTTISLRLRNTYYTFGRQYISKNMPQWEQV